MRKLDGIAHGINRLIGSLQELIDPNPLHVAYLQPRFYGKPGFGTHADRQYHQIGIEPDSRFQSHTDALTVFVKTFYRLTQIKTDSLLQQMPVYERSHRIVDGAHYLIRHFHNRYFGPGVMQVFRHLKSDKSAAYDDGTLYRMLLHVLLNLIGIANVTQGKNSFAVDARQRRTDGRCSRRQQ